MIILSIDPSLVATGLAVIELRGESEEVRAVSFVATKPDTKSRHVYQADKDGSRVDEIADRLLELLDAHQPDTAPSTATTRVSR